MSIATIKSIPGTLQHPLGAGSDRPVTAKQLQIRVWALTVLLGGGILLAGYILWAKVSGY